MKFTSRTLFRIVRPFSQLCRCSFRRHLRLLSWDITPPLSVPQSSVPAPVPQTRSDSESSPFSVLLYFLHLHLLHFSRPGEQSRGQTGSSPRPWDGRQKCRLHVDRNRISDTHELSLKRTPGHLLLRPRL